MGALTEASVSFWSNISISSTSRIVITLPGMSTCTGGYGNAGTSIVQHLVVQRIHVLNCDGTDALPVMAVGSSRQVSSTDSDGLCASSPWTTCYSRCKAIDSDWGVLGQYKNIIEMMPGFEIPANTRVVVDVTQLRMPSVPGPSGNVEVKIMGSSSACSLIQMELVGVGTCQLDERTFDAFEVLPATMPPANAKVSPRSLSVAQTTEYNVLFYSAAGVPKGGAITLTLPPGTVATDAVVNGAAISGKVRSALGKNVFLKSPASSKDDMYTGTRLAVMQEIYCGLVETKAFLDSESDTTT